jgi:polygalacturonase
MKRILALIVIFSIALLSRANGQAKLPENFAVEQPKIPQNHIKLADFSPAGDGKMLDTEAFKKAISAVQAAGGGVLDVPAGTYLTGPLQLVSNLELHLDKGATIKFSDDRSVYKLTEGGYEICLSATEAHDIAITGSGTIDGSGRSWWTEFRAHTAQVRSVGKPGGPTTAPAPLPHRPYMVMLINCTRVMVKDVTLSNSPMFHLVPKDCRDVTIDSVTITAPHDSPNTDGIDPSGWNYHIVNCTIDTGDDNIALKPHPAPDGHAGCENFLIEKMTFRHGHGMSIGGGSHGGVRNMVVRDCTFENTDSGVRMKAGRDRGGVAEQLTYENLKMTGVHTPIIIISYYPAVPADLANDPAKPITDHTPVWKNILIRNVTATDARFACRIVGLPEQHIQNVTLDHVEISSRENACQIIHADGVKFIDSKITSEKSAQNQIVDATVEGL